jgi:hypothetical protein
MIFLKMLSLDALVCIKNIESSTKSTLVTHRVSWHTWTQFSAPFILACERSLINPPACKKKKIWMQGIFSPHPLEGANI